ncbi:MAG: FMN-binding protein [Clostridiales bacterium]|nr:FMN-binding protein [Clostridiales bacterium]
MELLINVVLAWSAVILVVLLSIIWILRIYIKKKAIKNRKKFIYRVNRILRKNHKSIGISMVLVGILHGVFSSYDILSFNLGTLLSVMTILLGLTFYLRKKFPVERIWMKIHRLLVVAVVILIPMHIVEVGGVVGFDRLLAEFTETEIVYDDMTGNIYQDGVYTGVGRGYRDGLTVEVTLSNNLIEDIQIVSHNERGYEYYMPAFDQVPEEIIDSQSLNVDVVSGSTYSSRGIIQGVCDALTTALVSGEVLKDTPIVTTEEEHTGGGNGTGNGKGKNRINEEETDN